MIKKRKRWASDQHRIETDILDDLDARLKKDTLLLFYMFNVFLSNIIVALDALSRHAYIDTISSIILANWAPSNRFNKLNDDIKLISSQLVLEFVL